MQRLKKGLKKRSQVERQVIAALLIFIIALTAVAYYERGDKKNRKPIPKALLIGSCSTIISGNKRDYRVQNIKAAVELINNREIEPGGVFSFNKAVGSITPEKGFVDAPVIDDEGRFKLELGGGICQVSSTLYNAVLDAGLEVLERHPHSKPVNYVPAGRDATVYDDKDFCFRNNKNNNVRLIGRIKKTMLTIKIYQMVSR